MPKIIPPSALGDKHLRDFFVRWDQKTWPLFRNLRVELDISKSEFLAPWAVCLYAQYFLHLREVHASRISLIADTSSRAGRYAISAGLGELLDPGKYRMPFAIDKNMAPLKRIVKSEELPPFADEVIRLLCIGDEEVESAVRYSLIELMRNVVQHSKSPGGGLAMAQYFPKTGIVQVVVADTGLGIRETLSRKYPELDTDLKAIKMAINPYVSGTFAPGAYGAMSENAGLGLFFIKEIATRAHGGFYLCSRSALADYWGNADDTLSRDFRIASGSWPGTFAMFQLRKGSIAMYDSLLDLIRELANMSELPLEKLALNFVKEIPSGVKAVPVATFDEDVEIGRTVRDQKIIPALKAGKNVYLDFHGVSAPTQSFMHACLYKVFKDVPDVGQHLFLARCTESAKASARVVASYAKLGTDLPGYTE